jgi:hypothetical protein
MCKIQSDTVTIIHSCEVFRVVALHEALSVYWTNGCCSHDDYVIESEGEGSIIALDGWTGCTLMRVRGRKEAVDYCIGWSSSRWE